MTVFLFKKKKKRKEMSSGEIREFMDVEAYRKLRESQDRRFENADYRREHMIQISTLLSDDPYSIREQSVNTPQPTVKTHTKTTTFHHAESKGS